LLLMGCSDVLAAKPAGQPICARHDWIRSSRISQRERRPGVRFATFTARGFGHNYSATFYLLGGEIVGAVTALETSH
jgi:hypothetical protein